MDSIVDDYLERLSFIQKDRKKIIKPEDDLLESVIECLYREDFDYSENLVVFPGKRPAHYLVKKLSKRENSGFIPPKIMSIDEFVNFVFGKLHTSTPIEPIDSVGIIYKICIEKKSLNEFFSKFDNFLSYGFKLFNLFEELYIEGVSEKRLKEVDTLVEIPLNSKNHLHFISETYGSFYEFLKDKNLSTRSLRYSQLSECDFLSLINFKKIIFAGFFALTESEKRILERLSNHRGFMFLYQQPKMNFDEEKIKIYSCPDAHGQVKLVEGILKGLFYRQKVNSDDEKTVIVLPSAENLFPLIRHCMSSLKENNYNISMGYPLSRTPIFGFFVALFELLSSVEENRIYVPLYLKFMMHPYTKNVLFKNSAELSRVIIHEIEDFFKSESAPLFVDLTWIEDHLSGEIAKTLDILSLSELDIKNHLNYIHSNTINKFLEIRNIKDFTEKCKDVLLFIYENSTAKLHPLFYPYAEAFVNEFDKLMNSLIGTFEFDMRNSYFSFFKNFALSASVPFQGTPLKGIQILGFLETRNIKFERVIFLDLNEGIFPDLKEDYLLPYKLRKVLNLPTYQDRERLIYHYFSILIQGAKEAHLIYLKNDQKERSRFIEKIIWEIEKKRNQRFDERLNIISIRNYKINLADKIPKEIHKTSEIMEVLRNFTFSASSLDEYLKCGLKFYYSNILRLRKQRLLSDEMEYSDIGKIVHESLKEYFKQRTNRELSERDLDEDIESILNDSFKRIYGEKITGKVYILKFQMLKRLKEVISYYRELSKIRKFLVYYVEKSYNLEFLGSKFKCIIDRVDKIEDRYLIIDYKTSSNEHHYRINFKRLDMENRRTWAKAIGSLQIPLYIHLYSLGEKIDSAFIDGNYLLLGKKFVNDESFFDPLIRDRRHENLKTLLMVIKALLEEIKNPHQPFLPTDDFKNICKNCDYRAFCGTLTVPSNTSSAGPVI